MSKMLLNSHPVCPTDALLNSKSSAADSLSLNDLRSNSSVRAKHFGVPNTSTPAKKVAQLQTTVAKNTVGKVYPYDKVYPKDKVYPY